MIGAVDIGGTKIAAGVVNGDGRVLASTRSPTAAVKSDGESGFRLICDLLEEALARSGAGVLEGIGIGCTGPVDPFSGHVLATDFLPGWNGLALAPRLSKQFGVSAVLENDADAAALGEFIWGSGRGCQRFLYVTVSTGIGGGMVFDGKLYRGAGGAHPEIGHHILEASGPACYCGSRGCWEALVSGPALLDWFLTKSRAENQAGALDARWVCELAEAGDTIAQQAVQREGLYLGAGLANLINLYVPDVIALGGGVMGSWHLFEPEARRVIAQSCTLVPWEKVQIVPAGLRSDAGLAGAAAGYLLRKNLTNGR